MGNADAYAATAKGVTIFYAVMPLFHRRHTTLVVRGAYNIQFRIPLMEKIIFTDWVDVTLKYYLPVARNPNCGSCPKATVSKSISVSIWPTTLPLVVVVNMILPVNNRKHITFICKKSLILQVNTYFHCKMSTN